MVGGLGELDDDLHVAAGINAGPEEHFLEEVGAHPTNASKSTLTGYFLATKL